MRGAGCACGRTPTFRRMRAGRASSAPKGSASVAPSTCSSRRSEEHTSELQSPCNLVCRLLLEKKNNILDYQLVFLNVFMIPIKLPLTSLFLPLGRDSSIQYVLCTYAIALLCSSSLSSRHSGAF